MNVVFAPAVARALIEIWNYNAEHRSTGEADRYEAFLKGRLYGLATNPDQGKILKDDPDFRYLLMQKRTKADGYVAGYRIDVEAQIVRVLRIYHTKQDWQTYLEREGA